MVLKYPAQTWRESSSHKRLTRSPTTSRRATSEWLYRSLPRHSKEAASASQEEDYSSLRLATAVHGSPRQSSALSRRKLRGDVLLAPLEMMYTSCRIHRIHSSSRRNIFPSASGQFPGSCHNQRPPRSISGCVTLVDDVLQELHSDIMRERSHVHYSPLIWCCS